MANINKIKLSGTTYTIQDENATKTVELTQAQYDALAVKDPNTFYIITDAEAVDLANYYTKSETSGATQISTALNAKQNTLVAGDNITISGNVISASGGGSITVDSALDSGSTNPVANSAITTAINAKADKSTAGGGINISSTNNHEIVSLTNQNGVSISGYWKQIGFGRINNRVIVNQGTSSYENFSLVETSAITTSVTSASTDSQVPSAKAVYDQFGGLKLVKLTQAEYDALSPNYDSNTLYVIV